MRRSLASVLATAAMVLGGVVVTAVPAQAATIDCRAWMGDRVWGGQTRPKIDCDFVSSGWEARGRGDCTAAPDKYTGWVRSYDVSVGDYCAFGARGARQEARMY